MFLRTVKPLLGPEEFSNTTKVAHKFGAPGGAGESLQHLLEQKANNEPNWVKKKCQDPSNNILQLKFLIYLHS